MPDIDVTDELIDRLQQDPAFRRVVSCWIESEMEVDRLQQEVDRLRAEVERTAGAGNG